MRHAPLLETEGRREGVEELSGTILGHRNASHLAHTLTRHMRQKHDQGASTEQGERALPTPVYKAVLLKASLSLATRHTFVAPARA